MTAVRIPNCWFSLSTVDILCLFLLSTFRICYWFPQVNFWDGWVVSSLLFSPFPNRSLFDVLFPLSIWVSADSFPTSLPLCVWCLPHFSTCQSTLLSQYSAFTHWMLDLSPQIDYIHSVSTYFRYPYVNSSPYHTLLEPISELYQYCQFDIGKPSWQTITQTIDFESPFVSLRFPDSIGNFQTSTYQLSLFSHFDPSSTLLSPSEDHYFYEINGLSVHSNHYFALCIP